MLKLIRKITTFVFICLITVLMGAITVSADETNEIYSASLVIGNDLTMNISAIVDPSVKAPKLKVFLDKVDVEPLGLDGQFVEDKGRWFFEFGGINSQCMTSVLDFYLYDENGKELDNFTGYSVLQNCKNIFKNSNMSDSGKRLIADMLEYGAASQKFINYRTDDLANKDSEIAAYKSDIPTGE